MAKIAEVIKYEGDNTTFVWKHPCEDFNSLTQLIVHETQEAVFMMNGQALDLFGAGRYTLETQNIPKIGRLLNRSVDDTTPFHCEVYFINKTVQMGIKWGTDSKVQFMEPTYHFPVQLGACGEMVLVPEDSRKLLLKLVGTENVFDQAKLTYYFRAFLMVKVKSYLARVIRENSINIFEIDEQLTHLSEVLQGMLVPDFAEYGITLERFFVTRILLPEGDVSYERFKSLYFRQYADVAEAKLRQQVGIIEQQTEAQKMLIESQALAQKRLQEGYTYQQERSFDVAQNVAQNEAVGQFTNMGVGLGTMVGVGGTVGGAMGSMVNNIFQTESLSVSERVCAKCGTFLRNGAKFCPECGEKVVSVQEENLVTCPECGKQVQKAKFCPECGHRLQSVCPKCGANAGNSKFCPECGEKL